MNQVARRQWQRRQGGAAWPALAACLGAASALVVCAPARSWNLVLEPLTQGRVRLVNTAGTLWHGRGDLLLSGSDATAALPGGVAWQFGRADDRWNVWTLTLTLPCCSQAPWRWQLQRFDGRWMVRSTAHHSRWDLAWLTALGSPWNTLGLQGTLALSIEPLTWTPAMAGTTPRGLTGAWEAELLDLSSAVATVRPLGSYRLRGQLNDAQGPSLVLQTLEGDLQLTGSGGWQGGRFIFRGVAEASPQRLPALSNLLNLLGRRDGARAHLQLG
jgi:general secretion pathway protein N